MFYEMQALIFGRCVHFACNNYLCLIHPFYFKIYGLINYVITTSQSLAKDYANDAKIIKVLDDTLNLLENLPSQVDFVFHIQLSPEKMGATRNEVLINLRKNFYSWLGFFVYSTAYKIRHLVSDIVDGLNTHNYIRVTMASRAVMEYVAVFNHYTKELNPKILTLTSPAELLTIIETAVETIKSLQKYAQATRFNWLSYAKDDLEKFLILVTK